MAKESQGRIKAGSDYSAKHITVLEGLEPVRKRPGMYIGNTAEEGLHHLIWEVVDNSIDEAMAGFCDTIRATLNADGSVTVEDNGRGIPTEKHPATKVSTLETVMTKLHAGGKFGQGAYKVSGGLHGVGVSVVNALSKYMRAEVHFKDKVWVQEYERGKPKRAARPIGATKRTGTTVTFLPDDTIFTVREFSWEAVLAHLRQQAYLTKGVRMEIHDRRVAEEPRDFGFYFEGGVASYCKHLNHNKEVKNEVFYIEKEVDKMKVELAVQYTDDYKETVVAFANNIHTVEGGMHVVGFRTALTRSLNNYARKNNLLKEKDDNLSGEDVREGLTAIISVKIPEPQFEGQTKAKLGNAEVRPVVESVMNDYFTSYLEEHPNDARQILGKVLLAQQARVAARAARDSVLRKGALEGFMLPGKLADCSSKKTEECELYIVEGDSAGGCFSGDTKVALADGRNLSFIDLVKEAQEGKQNYCYTMNSQNIIEIAPIQSPRRTHQSVRVLKVVLDNGEEMTCTPDHEFLLANGSYKKVKDLTPRDSIMPLYRKFSKIAHWMTIDGYELVYQPAKNRWEYTHVLADEYNLRNGPDSILEGEHRHHKDYNKLNNNPDNIVRHTRERHLEIHRQHADKTLRRPEVLQKLREMRQTKEYREKIRQAMLEPRMRESLRERAKKQWENAEYKECMQEKFLKFYNSNEEYRKENREMLNREQHKYWADSNHRRMQSQRVKMFFEEHPKQREVSSQVATMQWKNSELREWRSQKTVEQWTPKFRAKRMRSYNLTYYHKALNVLHMIYANVGTVDRGIYEKYRKLTNDKSLLKFETIQTRFFFGDENKLIEAAEYYNHNIKEIREVRESMDVYDLEVPETHNFALAAGVFVHNSAKSGRDRTFQAILPLRGKILNVEKSRIDKMLANNEIKSLVLAIGTNIGELFDIAKLRYDKIIIMTDADVDGAHIRTLLLTFFYRHFPQLILQGHIYIAQPPLYQLKKGKSVIYVFSDEQKAKALQSFGVNAKVEENEPKETEGSEVQPAGAVDIGEKIQGVVIQRYKGLGEMNPDQLWETTMRPDNRMLKKVTIDDAEKANEIFDILMGSEVAPRKRFIQTHAKAVKNLDI